MIRAQTSHNAQESKQTCLSAGQKHAILYFGLNLRNAELAIFLAQFLLLVESGPKEAMQIERLDSSLVVSSIF